MVWRRRLIKGIVIAASALATAGLVEGGLALLLSHPAVLGRADGGESRTLAVFRAYFRDNDRRVVQYLPECARYDPALAYRLAPGSCTVVNREHVVRYDINRAGLRDDEAALVRPEVVVAGDSFALGWGVARDETFARRLGVLLGVRTLDAGQSSYGTARELLLLEQLDLSATRTIVLQYCGNDLEENEAFLAAGKLPIMSPERYAALVAEHAEVSRYRPFKHVRTLAYLARHLAARVPGKVDHDREAKAFLEVLRAHPSVLSGRTLVVLQLDPFADKGPGFIAALGRQLATAPFADLAASVRPLDVSGELAASDYYVLDDHLRASGHEKVARALARVLRTAR